MAKISYEEERKLTRALLVACGMSGEDADIAGDVVTHSDFTGVYSHGMSRLALYLRLFGTGAYNPRPNIKVLKDEGSVIHLDCDNALGVVTVNKAFDRLLPRAKESGIAICTGPPQLQYRLRILLRLACGGRTTLFALCAATPIFPWRPMAARTDFWAPTPSLSVFPPMRNILLSWIYPPAASRSARFRPIREKARTFPKAGRTISTASPPPIPKMRTPSCP